MNSLFALCCLGPLAFFAANLYGQDPNEALHDLVIYVEPLKRSGSGMGGSDVIYDPSHPEGTGNLMVLVVNKSKRDLMISPKHVRICAAGRWDLRLNGVPFLYDGDVTVPAGESLCIMKVRLADVLDPTRLKAQQTINWAWSGHPTPPTSPIMPNEKNYVDVGIFWVQHTRDRHVHRSRAMVIPVKHHQSR